MTLERESEGRELLPDEVVDVARDACPFVFLGRYQPSYEAADSPFASGAFFHLQFQVPRLAHTCLELGARPPERHLVLTAGGEVAGDLRVAPPLRVPERRRHPAAEQQRAVLAHVPPLILGAPLCAGELPLLLWHSTFAILWREQRIDRLADDLGFRVAEDALRARVPGGHRAVGVDRENRVVLHAVDEQPEAFLARAHERLGMTALRDIEKRHDYALDSVLGRPVRQHSGEIPAALPRPHLPFDRLEVVQYLLCIFRQLVVDQVARDVGERAPDVERQEVEYIPHPGGRELHAKQSIEEDRADFGRVDQVLEVVVRDRQLLDLDLQLLVDGRELLVDRLQLLLARLELLGGRPELFVRRLQFLVRRLRLLDLGFVLLDGGP